MAEVIIAVDDIASNRKMISLILKEKGYEVIEAIDGKDALEKLNPSVKMIITDLNMPNIDGIELIKRVKVNPDYKSIPIIILTAESEEEKKQEGKFVGAADWINKPIESKKLISVVSRYIQTFADRPNISIC